MVFCGLFPIDTDRYEDLRDALEKLALNDAALSWEPETSEALGFGFRCGFLGLLHMEIVRERLEREYGLELLATTPERALRGPPDQRRARRRSTARPICPTRARSRRSKSPTSGPRSSAPSEQVGAVMELCQGRRGTHVDMHYLSPQRVQIRYDMPLAEIVLDFFDLLKSSTRGYASLDYEPIGNRAVRPGQGRHPARRRQGRRALDHRPPRLRLRAGQARWSSGCARRSRASSSTSPCRRRSAPTSSPARPSRRCARTSPRSSTAATSPASRSC